MFGWRGKFGYVSPSTIQLPWELSHLLPDGVGVIATNLGVRAHQGAEFDRAQATTEAAIETVCGEGAQAVVLAGVPVAVRQGYGNEQARLGALSERFGVPIASGMATAVAAMQHLGVRRPAVVTAYLDEWNRMIVDYLAEAGLEATGVAGLSVKSPAEAARTEPQDYYRLARQVLAEQPTADAVFIGARGAVLQVAVQMEDDFGVPVVHGTQSGAWWALRQLGVRPESGHGRLLDA